jgi:hypothetical protein
MEMAGGKLMEEEGGRGTCRREINGKRDGTSSVNGSSRRETNERYKEQI